MFRPGAATEAKTEAKVPIPFRRLLILAWPERKLLGLGTLALAVSSATVLTYPMLIKNIVNEALGSGSVEEINKASLLVLLVLFLQGISSAYRYRCFTYAGERIVMAIREKVFKSLVEQDIAFFDQNRTGELMSRLSADTALLQNALSINISMLVRNIATAVGGTVLLLYTSPRLTLLLLLSLPFLGIGVVYYGRRIRDISKKVQDALAQSAIIAEETISGMRTVRAFAQESVELGRYRQALGETLRRTRKKVHSISLFMMISSLFGYAPIVCVIWYGGMLVIQKEMDIGGLMSFVLYTLTVGISVASLAALWTDFMAATGASRRVFQLLDEKPSIHLSGGRELRAIRGEVTFDNVHFAYPSRPDFPVLSGITLPIKAGEVVALVGPSGAGKSTVVSLIPRFYDVTTGRILVDGQDIRDLDATQLRRQIGMVAQDSVLMSSSIADNVRYGKEDASDEEVLEALRFAHAEEFIQRFPDGIRTIIGERGVQLSGGQRQRVAIARAVLKNPRILILDEATSALDAESEHHVREALDSLMKGRTTVVIAHRLSTVKGADRVLVLNRGCIVQEGSHDQLMADGQGIYRRLVERQFFNG